MVRVEFSRTNGGSGPATQHTLDDISWDAQLPGIVRHCFPYTTAEHLVQISRGATENHDPNIHFFMDEKLEVEKAKKKLTVVVDKPSNFEACEINHKDTLLHFLDLEEGLPQAVSASLDGDSSTSASERLVVDDSLVINFHRTIRLPDDNRIHQLPKSLGSFPLYNISAFAQRLPEHIVETGGVFFAMWQREALWIEFKNRDAGKSYAVRINVGGVNAVSGLTLMEKTATQDYVVVPGQPWIDGILVEPGVVRQFVAMPLGSGYTVEGQVTGKEKFGGFQIEVTPIYRRCHSTSFWDPSKNPVHEHKTPENLGLVEGSFLLMAPAGKEFRPIKLSDFLRPGEVPASVKLLRLEVASITSAERHLTRPIRKSPRQGRRPHQGPPSPRPTQVAIEAMGIAAGGKMIQDIMTDINPPYLWNASRTRMINVHIFSPTTFEELTHIVPHPTPISAAAYAAEGLPFFAVEEDPDNRLDGSETLAAVKSVSQMDEAVGVDCSGASSADTKLPKRCTICKTKLCDCIVRPCNHQFCFQCIQQVEHQNAQQYRCPAQGCDAQILRIAGFSAPMNLPGEEAFKVKVPVVVLEVKDGRTEFRSIHHSRI